MLYNYIMEKNKIFDCVIIGGGPAGITAGIYLKRAGKNVALLEGGMFGGQVATTPTVENYPAVGKILGFELATKFYEDLQNCGVKIIYENAKNVDFSSSVKIIETKNSKILAYSVILAMGVRPRQVNEQIEEKFKGKGISYCATCDGALFKGKKVAVIGGGKSAFIEAQYLKGLNCDVTLIHRTDKFRVAEYEVENLEKIGVKIMPYYILTDVFGNNKLEQIELTNVHNGEKVKIDIDGLFIAVGRVPNSELVAGKIKQDDMGFIISDDCNTNISGVFVAGDIRTKNLRQIVTATSDGAISATNAIMYLNNLKQ